MFATTKYHKDSDYSTSNTLNAEEFLERAILELTLTTVQKLDMKKHQITIFLSPYSLTYSSYLLQCEQH